MSTIDTTIPAAVELPAVIDASPVGAFAAAYRERLTAALQAQTDLIELQEQLDAATETDREAMRAAVAAGKPDPGRKAHDDLAARIDTAGRALVAHLDLTREAQAALVDALAGDPGAEWQATTEGAAAELGARARKVIGKARTDAAALVDKITDAERIAAWVREARDDAGQGYLAGADNRPAQPPATHAAALDALRVLEFFPAPVPAPEPEPIPINNGLAVHIAAKHSNLGQLALLRREIERVSGNDPGPFLNELAAQEAMLKLTQPQGVRIMYGEAA